MFSEDYISYLENFKFECDVWMIPERSIFPGEPIVVVRSMVQGAIFGDYDSFTINHQSLVATKPTESFAAQGRPVMEFGSRRAQGPDAAILGERAAFDGCVRGTA